MDFTRYTSSDFDHSPLMFYYEVTRACDLVCQHCRAEAQALADQRQLSTATSLALIEQIATFPKPPNLVLTGGDPLKRDDLWQLVESAVARGLRVALTPSATPLATRDALARAQQTGVSCLGISLDGASAEVHDSFRGWSGSYARTRQMLSDAQSLGLPVQINTTVTASNRHELPKLADQLADFGICMWSVFFLVPVGRGVSLPRLAPHEYEDIFAWLYSESTHRPYAIKTTEAPHYRRWVIEHAGDPLAGRRDAHHRHTPLGVRDGKGIMFVSNAGEILPAGFLPQMAGRFPRDSVVETYQHHPLFVALRDHDRLEGKCGKCEYRAVCGGSRSRAWAVTGNALAAEPDCVYEPHAS